VKIDFLNVLDFLALYLHSVKISFKNLPFKCGFQILFFCSKQLSMAFRQNYFSKTTHNLFQKRLSLFCCKIFFLKQCKASFFPDKRSIRGAGNLNHIIDFLKSVLSLNANYF